MILKSIKIFLGVLICLLFAACSIKYSTTGASIPPEMKTVSINNFDNRAPYVDPTFSDQLTEKLREKIRQNTKLILIADGGDGVFEGTITGYGQQPTAIQGNDQAAKNRFTVTVKVRFTNSVDPKLNFDASFSRYRDYDSNLSFEEGSAQKLPEIIDELTEDIFNKAFVNW